jgi:hemolysin III-related protein
VAVVAMPQLFARLGVAGGLLIVAGGLVYSAGAAVYALRRPDPAPAVFGYHEVFHLLVIAGVAATSWPSACTRYPPGEHSVRNWRSATGSLATDPPRGGPCR